MTGTFEGGPAATGGRRERRVAAVLAGAGLALLTVVSFWPLHRNGFILPDDPAYLTRNRHVAGGLSREGFLWALTATRSDNWHPLTWLAHMLDVELFGMNPAAHHGSDLALHAITAVLLFAVLRGITGMPGRSWVVAALFAVHPLRVESVAWAAEKKDLLAGLCWVLVIGCYGRYVRRPGVGGYLAVAGVLTLGLMAKPMLVTLPFVLLLLDWWPLGRVPPGNSVDTVHRRGALVRLLAEKAPLLALAAGASFVTYSIQSASGALKDLELLPLAPRVLNAALSYVRYLGKTVWPFGLHPCYPHPGLELPIVGALLSAGALLVVTLETVRRRGTKPWLATGWLWFLGTLVPVIGLVQVGWQGMADRYTYLPMIGPVLALCWEIGERLRGVRRMRVVAPTAVVLAGLSLLTWRQTGFWRDDVTLFGHAVAVTPGAMMTEFYLGKAYRLRGNTEEAARHLRAALQANPRLAEAYRELGMALDASGDLQGAVRAYQQVVYLDTDDAVAQNNLGFALAQLGEPDAALAHYREAIRINPRYARAHRNAGLLLAELGRTGEAEAQFRAAQEAGGE